MLMIQGKVNNRPVKALRRLMGLNSAQGLRNDRIKNPPRPWVYSHRENVFVVNDSRIFSYNLSGLQTP
jgi:hypothetical protein